MAMLIHGVSAAPAKRRNVASSVTFTADHANCLDIAIVNNMRDEAKCATERQYLRLIESASQGFIVRLTFYTLADTPRHDEQQRSSVQYQDISALWENCVDGVIVTGAEPKAPDLSHEPYWPSLTRTIDWCHNNASSAIWSCLAAHAAVLHLDGIKRQPLTQKCFGIFPCGLVSWHPLLEGLCLPLPVQHSRWNALDPAELRDAGYAVLTVSRQAGVDMFCKKGRCLSLFFQGHPEYEQDTLLREYRRDVVRYLDKKRDTYPCIPEGCANDREAAALLAFQARAIAERDPGLIFDLPLPTAPAATPYPFHIHARRLYRNWLAMLSSLKEVRMRTRARQGHNQKSLAHSRKPSLIPAVSPK